MEQNFENPLFVVPDFENLRALEIKKQEIQNRLDGLSEEMRPLYEEAIDAAQVMIAEEASKPELQTAAVTIGEAALRSLEELEPLRGLVDDEKINSLSEQYTGRLHAAIGFFESYGSKTDEAEVFSRKVAAAGYAVGLTTEVVSNQPATEEPVAGEKQTVLAPEEISKHRVQLKITVRRNSIQLGREPRRIPFKFLHAPSDQKREMAKRDIFLFMASQPGVEMSPKDIMNGAGITDDYSVNERRTIFNWLTSIEYRRSPVITHNGKTGRGSRFLFSERFETSVVERRDQMNPSESQPHTDEPAQAIGESVSTLQEVENDSFPIDRAYLWFVGSKLHSLNEVLISYKRKPISDELHEGLKELKPHVKFEGDEVDKWRKEAVDSVYELLSDTQTLLDLVDTLDEDSVEYKFLAEMLDLDTNSDQRTFLLRLMKSEWSVVYSSQKDNVIDTKPLTKSLLDSDGIVIWRDEGMEQKSAIMASRLDSLSPGTVVDNGGGTSASISVEDQPKQIHETEKSVMAESIVGNLVKLHEDVQAALNRLESAEVEVSNNDRVSSVIFKKALGRRIGTEEAYGRMKKLHIDINEEANTRIHKKRSTLNLTEAVCQYVMNANEQAFKNGSRDLAMEVIHRDIDVYLKNISRRS